MLEEAAFNYEKSNFNLEFLIFLLFSGYMLRLPHAFLGSAHNRASQIVSPRFPNNPLEHHMCLEFNYKLKEGVIFKILNQDGEAIWSSDASKYVITKKILV